MSADEENVKKRRILRFIRDLDLRYIRGSIDRRTYQTLKNKYQEILNSLPTTLKVEEENAIEQAKKTLPQVESDFHDMEKEPIQIVPATAPQTVVEMPSISIEEIPPIEIEELKIRYVMHMAIKAATKTFEQEMNTEQDYVEGKLEDQDYISKKNEIEAKQHKIFQNFYKLSELLFSVCKDHLFKDTHNNFLLFNNELSENINRLRRMETDKSELKGILYDINERVLRHRPILKKAAQETLKWKVKIQQEKEKFNTFFDIHENNLSIEQKEEIERKSKQLEIYEELLDDDVNDYDKDVDAMDVLYGEHLRYQEIVSPYFKDLTFEIEDRIQRYSEIISSLLYRTQIAVSTSSSSRDLDYQLMNELKSLWRYTGKPVVDEQEDLVGFMAGPGQLNEQFGIVIMQQQEISLSMVRRIYDHIVAPSTGDSENLSELDKKEYLLNEIPRIIPQVPFTYLIPKVIIEYCNRVDSPLTDELKEVMLQSSSYLFIPIEFVNKTTREIRVKNEKILQKGEILPYFNPAESNIINDHIKNNENVEVKDITGKEVGGAHSVIYHPGKGYFLVVERKQLSDKLYEQIYDFLYSDITPHHIKTQFRQIKEKKRIVKEKLAEEYEIQESSVTKLDFLKKVLIEKNTGILPEKVENARFSLISLGNVRILGDVIQVNFGSPFFELSEVFNLEGKVVENVKGTEIGVVYNLQLLEKPMLYVWTSIDLMLIASFIHKNPEKLFVKDKNFVDNLAISIGKQLSIAPQIALRPDIVMTFMNLAGKLSSIEHVEDTMKKFNPKAIEMTRIISVDKRKILADISDKEIMEEIYTDIEVGESEDDSRFVTSPDYFLREQ